MEPVSTRLRAATDASATANTSSSANSRSLHARAALQFAEKRQYRELLHAIQLRPELAAATDAFGMTPLHWLCTDRDVPLRALQALVLAYPTATTVRSLVGLLPLHMAVRKDLSLDALKTVLKFYPKAVVAETPQRATPVELAQAHLSSDTALQFLHQLEQEVRALGRVPPASSSTTTAETKNSTSTSTTSNNSGDGSRRGQKQDAATIRRGWEDGYPVAIVESSSATTSTSQPSTSQRSRDDSVGTQPLPPVWKLSACCYTCDKKFGFLNNRHHCRNCGESVCSNHSRHRVPLKHLGLFHAQRVCSGCYGRLQSHYTSRAVARLSPHSASARQLHDVVDTMAPSPMHHRPTRSRSAYSMTFSQQQNATLSPRLHPQPTPSPLNITPPLSTRSARSATMSPRSCRSASSNTLRSNGSTVTTATTATTASTKHQPNFVKMPSGMSMHITHVQRTGNQPTVLERQREMQRRRNRLANTDIETYAWHGRESEMSSPVAKSDNQDQDNDDADTELVLEMRMEKLLLAKKQIRDALQRSKRDVSHAQAEKSKYDGLAKEFEQHGYSYSLDADDVTRTFVGSESGIDDVASRTGSMTAAKYGYSACDDNQHDDDDADFASVIVHGAVDNNLDDEDDDDAAVYGLVPETTPSDPVGKESMPLFTNDSLDVPLDLATTYRDLGIVLLAKGDFADAVVELQRSVNIDPSNAQAWYHFAKALDGKGESADAEHAIGKSLAIEPNSLPSLSLLGKLLNARGEHDEAILIYRRALNLQCPSNRPPVQAC